MRTLTPAGIRLTEDFDMEPLDQWLGDDTYITDDTEEWLGDGDSAHPWADGLHGHRFTNEERQHRAELTAMKASRNRAAHLSTPVVADDGMAAFL